MAPPCFNPHQPFQTNLPLMHQVIEVAGLSMRRDGSNSNGPTHSRIHIFPWRGQTVQVFSDNSAAVAGISSQTSRVTASAHLLRCLSFISACHQCTLIGVHLPGRHNTLADALSRNKLSLFQSLLSTGIFQALSDSQGTNVSSTPRSPRLDITSVDRAVDSYFCSGLAPSTNRTYVSGVQQYIAICEQLHTKPTPTSEQLLCRFCTILANKGGSHSTIKVYLSAVRQLHVQRSQCMPTISDMPRLCQVLRGIKGQLKWKFHFLFYYLNVLI